MVCASCGTENKPGRRFCAQCASPLAAPCSRCGAANDPGDRFCGQCASPLEAEPTTRSAPVQAATTSPPVAERRLVSVLFADLVGFTAIADGRDAEETRELLGRYFELARDVVERYGGVIEKFIGDAVMAVWGAPVAREDDAERAVRAGLELVAAIPTIETQLRARAGVLTGEAAVTLGAAGQGMVAGDLVNTASRLQSAAPPGAVFVGEATQRAASNAIAFEQAGDQLLKGKTAPVPAWRALHVVARVGGAGRSEGFEAPFVGRERELRLLKDAVGTTGEDGRARLISIVGVGGIGKSRLIWELEKYLDGVVESVYWHQGRSPAYGDGIAFWALGEMVRRRARIAEADDAATTAAKVDEAVIEWVTSEDDRGWVRQRLRSLLGLEEPPAAAQREEMFAAWRRFFEGIAERGTTILVFEDLQWADPGLLDFVESMIQWSRNHRLLVITLARPELLERRPTWGAGQRAFTSLRLDPLPDADVRILIRGMASGLSDEIVDRIVARAEGIPLYAVETFRMLVDRGALAPTAEGRMVAAGTGVALDVPESLHALIASRLDALDPADRALVQDASVLGQTFTLDSLAAVVDQRPGELEVQLRGLVRREILILDLDPRSPERGQYGFVQSLIREVAYTTLARRERRSKHLAVARFFEALGDEELSGVLATHYVEAHAASTPGPEADALAAQARIALRGAAERALALHSPDLALGYLERALAVTQDTAESARLHDEAARAGYQANRMSASEDHARAAIAAFEASGDPAGAARAAAMLGVLLMFASRIEEASGVLAQALGALPEGDASPEAVIMLAQLGRAAMFASRPDEAVAWLERGLAAAPRIDDVAGIADMLITRAWAVQTMGRWRESVAILQGALEMSVEHGLLESQQRARNNLATFFITYGPRRALEIGRPGLEMAERLGHSGWAAKFGFLAIPAFLAGEWEWAEARIDEHFRDDLGNLTWTPLAAAKISLAIWRGDDRAAETVLAELGRRVERGTAQDRFAARGAEAEWALAHETPDRTWEAAMALVAVGQELGDAIDGWIAAGRAAALATNAERLRQTIVGLEAGPPGLDFTIAHRTLYRGALEALDGNVPAASTAFREAADVLRRTGSIWSLALARLVELAVLRPPNEERDAALGEAREIGERLGAHAFLEMLDRFPGAAVPTAGTGTGTASTRPVLEAG
ncbi:MAG: AAA family ATPase [Chloroflexi bacterium]|nr:AAA family ATPase [Chloroflexota bacterium]